MSRISNKFFITAIEDGSTIRGVLNSNKSLSQAWNGTNATPTWDVYTGPVLSLSVTKNGQLLDNVNNLQWYYNGEAIFQNDGTTIKPKYDGIFEKEGAMGLRIISDLANADNTDLDIIKVTGTVEANGSQIPFSASREIKIRTISADGLGYFGQIEFMGGINNFTSGVESIVAIGKLYQNGSSNYMRASDYTVDWYVNETKVSNSDASAVTPRIAKANESDGLSGIYITPSDITDIGSIKAEFKVGKEIVFTDYAVVDDMIDPEFLWIFNEVRKSGSQISTETNTNGGVLSLRAGQEVVFTMWVGKSYDSTQKDTSYNTFYLLLLDSKGAPTTLNDVNLEQAPADLPNYRKLPYDNGVASVTIGFDTVTSAGGSMTGVILAQSSN